MGTNETSIRKITVFGLGAIGSNLTVQLAKQYPEIEYTGIDFDKIEERNIGPQAYFHGMIGQPKTHALRAVLSQYVRRIKYKPVNHRVTEANKPIKTEADELFIDCFDNSASRKLVTPPGDQNILHVGFSPLWTAEMIWNKNYQKVPGDVPAGLDICEFAGATGFIHFVVNLASITISDFIETGKKKQFLVTNKYMVKEL